MDYDLRKLLLGARPLCDGMRLDISFHDFMKLGLKTLHPNLTEEELTRHIKTAIRRCHYTTPNAYTREQVGYMASSNRKGRSSGVPAMRWCPDTKANINDQRYNELMELLGGEKVEVRYRDGIPKDYETVKQRQREIQAANEERVFGERDRKRASDAIREERDRKKAEKDIAEVFKELGIDNRHKNPGVPRFKMEGEELDEFLDETGGVYQKRDAVAWCKRKE